MKEIGAYFSKKELSEFLEELASQVETGRVSIEIPGYSKGSARIDPEQPIDVLFRNDDEERKMTIEIEFEDRRNLEF